MHVGWIYWRVRRAAFAAVCVLFGGLALEQRPTRVLVDPSGAQTEEKPGVTQLAEQGGTVDPSGAQTEEKPFSGVTQLAEQGGTI